MRVSPDSEIVRRAAHGWGGCGMCGAAGSHRLPLAHPDLHSAFEGSLAVFAETCQCVQPWSSNPVSENNCYRHNATYTR